MKDNIINAFVGDKLKSLREQNGYSLNDVASRVNMHKQTYYNYENGSRSIPIEKLAKICGIYNVDYLELLQNALDQYIAYLQANKDNPKEWF